jgi:hypothetical protein
VNANLTGFHGGFTDGRYAYLVPYDHSLMARVDLTMFTATSDCVKTLDLVNFFSDAELDHFEYGFTDGKYGYLVPYGSPVNGKVVKFPLKFSGNL